MQAMTSYLFHFQFPLKVGQERGKLWKFQYLDNEKSTSGEMKNIFHNFLGLSLSESQ